jgi:hypothetical protein
VEKKEQAFCACDLDFSCQRLSKHCDLLNNHIANSVVFKSSQVFLLQ